MLSIKSLFLIEAHYHEMQCPILYPGHHIPYQLQIPYRAATRDPTHLQQHRPEHIPKSQVKFNREAIPPRYPAFPHCPYRPRQVLQAKRLI
ncbi:hypothetical protein SKAU_G00387390 [Synaphobranchus kaupii]|uniref:Uncharacterized protein n=1 Tax=Synaphobranchus kaupii TaxID=118154 RepID=A0A9Q1EAT0_SYNKA|nr:hypothetical protein SKAU_G00387390 [Synaphobranchus kaupii]